MWTQEENKIIIENHNKLTLPQIMKLLPNQNHSYYAMKTHCRRNLNLFRDKTKIKIPIKNHHNQEYWNKPNLINSYYAGFIAADGCIKNYKNYITFAIKLSIKDEQIINNFIKELNYEGKKSYCFAKSPHSDNISKFCYIQIQCFQKNAENLKKYYNIIPQKTKRLAPTNLINKYLNWSFIIGLIDGDGCIGIKNNNINNNWKSIYLNISSSSQFIIKWLKEIFDKFFPSEKYSMTKKIANIGFHKEDSYYRITLNGLRAAIILDYLSKFPVPKLSRKWENPEILEFINEKKKQYPDLFIELDLDELNRSVNTNENNLIS